MVNTKENSKSSIAAASVLSIKKSFTGALKESVKNSQDEKTHIKLKIKTRPIGLVFISGSTSHFRTLIR